MRFLHRLVDAISARTRFVFLTPATYAIGNCSEEILFGLIRARREGKKLVILRTYALPRMFRYPAPNRELFDIVSPHRADLPDWLKIPIQAALTAVYGSLRALDLLLGKVFGPKAHLNVRFISPGFGGTTLWQPEEEPSEFRWDIVDKYRWQEEIQKPLSVGLRPEKRVHAHALRLQMGIPEDAWFVGLHVREPGFTDKNEAPSCRNATIANYIPAIREITARGGWVVRLGDKSMTPLPAMERVVDYPFTPFKSELMDAYLISEARFFIGMASGIYDMAMLFQRPMILVNLTNWIFVYPMKPGDLGTHKHIYSSARGRFLSLEEILEEPFESQQFREVNLPGYDLLENTEQEIRDVVVEFLDRPGDPVPSSLQLEFNRRRLERGRLILTDSILADHYDDMHSRYRIASRLVAARGCLGNSFLEANWSANSRSHSPAAPSDIILP